MSDTVRVISEISVWGGGGSSFNKNTCMVGVSSHFVGLFEEKAKIDGWWGGERKYARPPTYSHFWISPNHKELTKIQKHSISPFRSLLDKREEFIS